MFYEVMVEGMGGALTYDFDGDLATGQIVMVPLGKKAVPGVVVKKVAQPNFKTKSILKILYSEALPEHLAKTAKFVNDYYLMTNSVSLILPRGVEKKRRKTEQMFGSTLDGSCRASSPSTSPSLGGGPPPGPSLVHVKSEIPLNPYQKKALIGLQKAPGATKLLFGVTGSGKTNIYLKMALDAFKRQKSTILLVPEIALTGQLVRVFQEFFGDKVVLIHSKQTEAERHLIWESLLKSGQNCSSEGRVARTRRHGSRALILGRDLWKPSEESILPTPKIVIGPRSALFAPLNNLGLIIIDEEHESSYYQENSPKYSAIRVASFMAQELKIPLILGSATPTVEDFYLAKKLGSLVELTEKAKSTAVKPKVKIVDFKDREAFSKNKYFSTELLNAIKKNLEQGRQTLIFHNRRGSSPLTICEDCGEEILCPHCFLPLTLHADTYELVCHTCGFTEKVPVCCPKCGAPGLVHKGFGTKLIESELKKLFSGARIQRFDADSKVGLEEIYDEVKDGGVDILVGTQTLAKGLDLPKLATVGVVQADAGLNLPDFVAEERTFQLLTQVMGRVGRGHIDTAEVFIQTFRPEHPVIKFAMAEDYLGFYEYEIKRRARAGFPPYNFVMKLEITMKTEATVLKKVRELNKKIVQCENLISSPPMPAFHERTDKGYTWQIIVRSKSRKALVEICDGIDKNFKITLDPPRLL